MCDGAPDQGENRPRHHRLEAEPGVLRISAFFLHRYAADFLDAASAAPDPRASTGRITTSAGSVIRELTA